MLQAGACLQLCWGLGLLGAANGDLVDLEGGLADADGDALPFFTTDANAGVEGEIITDHRDLVHGGRAVADKGGAFDWLGHFAIFDQVGFAGGEDELTGGNVYLASAKVDGVEAFVY